MVIHFAHGMVTCIMSQKPLYMNTRFYLVKIKRYLLPIDQTKQTISFQIV